MNKTLIEWTDFSVNPIRARHKITGRVGHMCLKISPGCAHCYASRLQKRFGMPTFDAHDPNVEPFLDESVLARLLKRRKPCKVFLGDMTDIFGDWVPDEWLDKIFAVMSLTPHVTYQILTKRSGWMRKYFADLGRVGEQTAGYAFDFSERNWSGFIQPLFPLQNCWLGVSVETQEYDYRITDLLATPAAVRFVSYEPALGPVDFESVRWCREPTLGHRVDVLRAGFWSGKTPTTGMPVEGAGEFVNHSDMPRLDWVICGGESGPGARPMHPDWARSVRDQCVAAGVPFFFKQWGAFEPIEAKTIPPQHKFAVRCIRSGDYNVNADGSFEVFDDQISASNEGIGFPMRRVGKKAAGRLLDGREWSEFPS